MSRFVVLVNFRREMAKEPDLALGDPELVPDQNGLFPAFKQAHLVK
jgi:hypothetical protein